MKTKDLINKTPEPEDQDAFDTINRIFEDNPSMEDNWINVFLTRFHCKPLSYYLQKYS